MNKLQATYLSENITKTSQTQDTFTFPHYNYILHYIMATIGGNYYHNERQVHHGFPPSEDLYIFVLNLYGYLFVGHHNNRKFLTEQ